MSLLINKLFLYFKLDLIIAFFEKNNTKVINI